MQDDVVDGLGKLVRGEEIVLPEPEETSAASEADDDKPEAAAGG